MSGGTIHMGPVGKRRVPRPARGGGLPLLSIGFDLDNLWSYQKTHGDLGWESFPSYLDTLVRIVLDRLSRHSLTATFFVVGQDAALEKNRPALTAVAEAGHEIGNHSFRHEPWLHLYSPAEIDAEIAEAERSIEWATGRRTKGFRGPGFSFSDDTVRALAARGYLYDASSLPTFLGPLARAYYFWSSRGLSTAERQQRKQLFGTFRDGLRPNHPYCWEVDGRRLAEIPVTTMPLVRSPIHLSYLVYLAGHGTWLSRAYLRTAVRLCRLTRTEVSFLLHPLDFLGADQVQALSFFPGMNLSTGFKLGLFDWVIGYLKRFFVPVTMEQHARAVIARADAR